uniref:Putative capsid protein n=1 Tax=Periparus ater Circoviridae sp. TaxID=2815004 RepID=A0A8A4XB33_9CIRC|nr:MAG: putative capsid protein [Periparus ater Circoviridae sp.]
MYRRVQRRRRLFRRRRKYRVASRRVIRRKRTRRIGLIRRTFKCPALYRLVFKKDDVTASPTNARNFILTVVPHVLKCAQFASDIQRYRYCKINKFMFKWRASAVTSSIFVPGKTREEDKLSVINSLLGDIDLNFNWNLDTEITKIPDGVLCNATMRKLRVGSKKGLYFTYTPPSTIRRFYDTSGLAGKAQYVNDGLGNYLSQVSGLSDFRAPDEWRGGCLQWWDVAAFTQVENAAPIIVNLYCDTYVNVTLRGYK